MAHDLRTQGLRTRRGRRGLALLLLAALPLGTPLPALALDVPKSESADPRIRWVAYDPLQVYRVVGVFRTAVQLVLAPNETIVHVALGDTVAWEVAADRNILFLKPREKHPPTNLILTTERTVPGGVETRNYAFELQIRSGAITARTPQTYFQVRFRYPDDEAADRRRGALAGLEARTREAEKTLVDLRLDHAVLEGRRNFKYEVQGSASLQPSEVSDNGLFTVLRFPGSEAIPSIFTVTPDGSESLVPFDVRGEFVVIHAVARVFRLRRGSEVLCIYNEALDPYGVDLGTGTASPSVERTSIAPAPHLEGAAREP